MFYNHPGEYEHVKKNAIGISEWSVKILSTSGLLSGWWFGTWLLFFHAVGNFIIPTDKVIFFRGVGTTNQIIYVP